jgi:hypothetical protein
MFCKKYKITKINFASGCSTEAEVLLHHFAVKGSTSATGACPWRENMSKKINLQKNKFYHLKDTGASLARLPMLVLPGNPYGLGRRRTSLY